MVFFKFRGGGCIFWCQTKQYRSDEQSIIIKTPVFICAGPKPLELPTVTLQLHGMMWAPPLLLLLSVHLGTCKIKEDSRTFSLHSRSSWKHLNPIITIRKLPARFMVSQTSSFCFVRHVFLYKSHVLAQSKITFDEISNGVRPKWTKWANSKTAGTLNVNKPNSNSKKYWIKNSRKTKYQMFRWNVEKSLFFLISS